MTSPKESLAAWAQFWETLSPESVASSLNTLAEPDIRFCDPFNEIVGVQALEGLILHMFQALSSPRFVVCDQAMGRTSGALRWDFDFVFRGRSLRIEGMSEIQFSPRGRVTLHRDHWDAGRQVYAKIPVLGAAIRLVRGKLATPDAFLNHRPSQGLHG